MNPSPLRQDVPLPDAQLEQIAVTLFRFKYPLTSFDNRFCGAERDECRRLVLQLRSAFQTADRWTLGTASEQLTDELCHLMYGDVMTNSIVRVAVTDFSEAVIEDASKLFSGDRSESWQHNPEDEPDDSELQVVKKGRVN